MPHISTVYYKGWVSYDDAVKPSRGISVGKHMSIMAPKTPTPQHAAKLKEIAVPVANEVRLQQLHSLHTRRAWSVPGPGAYEVRQGNLQKSTITTISHGSLHNYMC